ncbi:MAG: P1 family peptidase [Phycicoccus sp.]|nr:P1 family peptidase [Phycicoccus sp.]
MSDGTQDRVRARDLGVPFDGTPGPHNAITDVPGVEVGMVTILDPDEATRKACTGVTAILPRGRDGVGDPCAAGIYSLNGNGEMTGRSWIEESGALALPIAITNSHAVGAVHTGVDQWVAKVHPEVGVQWMLPTVAETWDGYLNDINGGHVRPEHAHQALDGATSGPVQEGCVGGGTGMNCYGFKGGTGTASRVVSHGGTDYTVGVLMQANFGVRKELTLHGVKLGAQSAAPQPMTTTSWFADEMAAAGVRRGAGSVIVIVGTDAPLIPTQCEALARRVALGLARTGTPGGHFSGDIFLAFSTGNSGTLTSRLPRAEAGPEDYDTMRLIPWGYIDAFYEAVVQATEEAVMNALVAAVDTVGRDGHASYALPHDEIRAAFGTA